MTPKAYPIHVGEDAPEALRAFLAGKHYSSLLLLTDEQVRQQVYPRLAPFLPPHQLLALPPGEAHKNLESCTAIWARMTEMGLDRRGAVLNLGGGVIGDMGGFAAATFKRGVDFVQVPTTLLAQVDASVGGKLGIDFLHYKNQIGVFREPAGVFIAPQFLETLPPRELRSGFAEVIKHHLIADAPAWEALRHMQALDSADWAALIRHSLGIKAQIVAADPLERGPRKALNFGHTLGHAIESYFLESGQPLTHGEAIAAGMICEAWLSCEAGLLSEAEYQQVSAFIRRFFPPVELASQRDFNLYFRTLQDKKNSGSHVRYVLLDGIGRVRLDQEASREAVFRALAAYRAGL
jgi:3-dehydroquinate synthase